MAARALEFFERDMATTPSDIRKLFEAIAASKESVLASLNSVNVSVAGLQEKVSNMGLHVSSLAADLQSIRTDKASRPELAALEARIDRAISDARAESSRELARVEGAVSKDVDGFEGMYESVLAEMKDFREAINTKLDGLIDARREQGEAIKHIDERLKKIEPLWDIWMKALGAKWIIAIGSGLLGSILTMLLSRWIGK